MICIGHAAHAAARRFRVDGHGAGAWIHPYFGVEAPHTDRTRPSTDAYPVAYRVCQDPSTAIQTHFHQVDQFQVVLGGRGSLGRADLAPVCVHYAAAHTGYGPLQAGPDGLDYLTVRNRWDPGLRPLPEARAELDRAGERRPVHRLSALPGASTADGSPTHTLLIDPVDAAGAGAWRSVFGAGPIDLRCSRECDGAAIVLSGAIDRHGEALGVGDCAVWTRGAPPTDWVAATDATMLLCLQFAPRAPIQEPIR